MKTYTGLELPNLTRKVTPKMVRVVALDMTHPHQFMFSANDNYNKERFGVTSTEIATLRYVISELCGLMGVGRSPLSVRAKEVNEYLTRNEGFTK